MQTSEAATGAAAITGRCSCDRTSIRATARPRAVAYRHCPDRRRATGAPVAAFDADAVTFSPDEGRRAQVNPGVERWFRRDCGSPPAGRYDDPPGRLYIALGLLDQADASPPELHAHDGRRLAWLRIDDDLARIHGSSRGELTAEGD